MSRQPVDRSLTFRIPEADYERLQFVAFADLRDRVGEDARVSKINMSAFLRGCIERQVLRGESLVEGGADALARQHRQAQIAELKSELEALQQDAP